MQNATTSVERAAPGIAELFDGLSEGGEHVILDLGPASSEHLRLYGRFARQVRFADILPDPPDGEPWGEAVEGLPAHPRRPYDVVLTWDVLDRLAPELRPDLIRRLDEITAPKARLYTLVDASGDSTIRPLRYTLVGTDRVSEEEVGPQERAWPSLLPAQVERMLAPFDVVRAFTLRSGKREYVAVKGAPKY